MEHNIQIPSYRQILDRTRSTSGEIPIAIISNTPMPPLFSNNLRYANLRLKPYCRTLYDKDVVSCNIGILYIDLKYFAPDFYDHYYLFTPQERKNRLRNIVDWLKSYLNSLLYSTLICINFLIPLDECVYGKEESYVDAVLELNHELYKYALMRTNVSVVDINRIVSFIGVSKAMDERFEHIMNMPFTHALFHCLARECAYALERINAPVKKCIITDCDGVLWGGISAEDGIDGIKLSTKGIGAAYRAYQRELTKLYSLGFLICLCSKGDLNIINQIFMNHSGMLLRQSHICAMRIGEENKADAIRSLAMELNIGLDSMVFLDDSMYEIGLVQKELPEVTTIWLNPDHPWEYVKTIKMHRLLPVCYSSKSRTEWYQQQKARKELLLQYSNIDDYHQKLETKVRIGKISAQQIPRIAELSMRCQQFNLSNRHYSSHEIITLLANSQYDILVLEASDIFGDMGLVCAAILRHRGSHLVIEAFFQSCRVFGRGFEESLMDAIHKYMCAHEKTSLMGIYCRTEKNARFQDFYLKHGVALYEE